MGRWVIESPGRRASWGSKWSPVPAQVRSRDTAGLSAICSDMLLLPPKFNLGSIRRPSSKDLSSLSPSTIDLRYACSQTLTRRGSAHRPSNAPLERCRSKRISSRLERGRQPPETPISRVSAPKRPGSPSCFYAGKRPRSPTRSLSIQQILGAYRATVSAG